MCVEVAMLKRRGYRRGGGGDDARLKHGGKGGLGWEVKKGCRE